jgi:beta-glucanase (GH16 family)
MKYFLFAAIGLSFSLTLFSQISNLKNKTNSEVLVWSDEFDIDGAIDATKWFHQTQIPGGGNWYNGEVQHYTDRLANTNVSNGILNLVAKKETFSDQGYTKQYTSARLNSKYAFTYGKIKVRAKLPTGIGTWPAIWMLGKNITESGGYWANDFGTTPWPACGEIDIMEHWGSNQNFVQSAMHTPSSFGGTVNHGGQNIPTASTEFHIYELDWNADRMIFSVDGNVHYTYNPEIKDANTWPYNAEQYFLLNIAIQPSIDGSFTQDAMEIDYVRVYEATPSEGGGGGGGETEVGTAENIHDDFEGNGTITTWAEDETTIDTEFTNPYSEEINTSNTVLKYVDIGGSYANVRFDTSENFDLSSNSSFSLKVYVPSNTITGTQINQISLKLQDGKTGTPWGTQSEIIKPIFLDQWQEISFDFATDSYINLDANSSAPITRTDFNRIVLQVNSENNNDHVTAYFDDFAYNSTLSVSNVKEAKSIQISPNPTTGKINISGEIDTVEVFNLNGQSVLKENSNTIYLDFLPRGVYLIQVISKGNTTISKIIKQ